MTIFYSGNSVQHVLWCEEFWQNNPTRLWSQLLWNWCSNTLNLHSLDRYPSEERKSNANLVFIKENKRKCRCSELSLWITQILVCTGGWLVTSYFTLGLGEGMLREPTLYTLHYTLLFYKTNSRLQNKFLVCHLLTLCKYLEWVSSNLFTEADAEEPVWEMSHCCSRNLILIFLVTAAHSA